MVLRINNISLGRYNLRNSLFFNFSSMDVVEKKTKPECIELEIDKKSALEIAHTLIDSVDLLDNKTEKLLEEIEEKVLEEIEKG